MLFIARNGEIFDVHVWAPSRPGDTWQAWLAFTRQGDPQTYSTGIETTQPSEAAVLY